VIVVFFVLNTVSIRWYESDNSEATPPTPTIFESFITGGDYLLIPSGNTSKTYNSTFKYYMDYSHRRERFDLALFPYTNLSGSLMTYYSIGKSFEVFPSITKCYSQLSGNFTTPFGWLPNSTYSGTCQSGSHSGYSWKYVFDTNTELLACISKTASDEGSYVPYHMMTSSAAGYKDIFTFTTFNPGQPDIDYFVLPNYCSTNNGSPSKRSEESRNPLNRFIWEQ